MLAALQELQIPIVLTLVAIHGFIIVGLTQWTAVIRVRQARDRRDSVR